MRKEVYICDHCRKELNPMNDYTEIDINNFDFVKEVDLCEECYNELCNIVREFIGENLSK